jgi:hypothetical protein
MNLHNDGTITVILDEELNSGGGLVAVVAVAVVEHMLPEELLIEQYVLLVVYAIGNHVCSRR